MGAANRHETREQRFSRLFQETRDEILAYLVRRARSMEDAADALSETYAAAWRKLDTLPPGDGARLWWRRGGSAPMTS
jgi:DNA-directed RNA polymerase specialized sigma24 family protein